eukprot:TRINITY_DN12879_c0_g4_i2.p1 TRINITY_DN12879_c0_g4~~TRINITY_DN12879_c0_g4_i2.p1  ORF type:complete len:760 (+),score=124.35 TRINITY_DN12879_c0_g4_i2:229-2280(+)
MLVIIMLAVDELNPVKVFCGYVPRLVTPGMVAWVAWFVLVALSISQRKHLLYWSARLFFRCTFNNMFFRSVEVVGAENLPAEGPVIITGNHNNQFVDAVVLITNCKREISFMIAQKSADRPLVGFLARTFHCIPVKRPQDSAFSGSGRVVADGTKTLRGRATNFLKQVEVGAQLSFGGKTFKVKGITSDVELTLDTEAGPTGGEDDAGESYKVLPKVDQSGMYHSVFESLRQGKCLGIFPEGGSHDRTDLLPLKAGVAIIALDAYSKHHINVPIVPVGLNYFHGHRFGGRVVVEFGTPIKIPESIYAMEETDRRGATDALLKLVANGMRSTIVPTPDYNFLQQVYMVRRLYVPDGVKLSPERIMDLNRRFAFGATRIMSLANSCTASSTTSAASAASSPSSPSGGGGHDREGLDVSPSPDGVQMELSPDDLRCIESGISALKAYMAELKRLGLRDHQVRQIGWWSLSDLVGRVLYLVVLMALGGIPQLLFNLPVMYIASRLASNERLKSLQASTVKLTARDVVMSYKIIYVLIFVPALFLFYFLLFFLFSSWTMTTIVLVLAACPLFAFLGMKASEQGVRAYTDIVPLVRRLMPGPRREQDLLPSRRAALKRRVKQMVKTFGPMLGDLYYQKEVDWGKELLRHQSSGALNWSPQSASLSARPMPEPEALGEGVRKRAVSSDRN